MSLFKQIAGVMSLFIVIMMCFVMWMNFSSNKKFIQDQLFYNSIDTANSLGLSIQNSNSFEDVATIEGMITSVFDNGFFEKIELVDVEGKPLVAKILKNRTAKDVPEWFISLVDITFADAKATISNGWTQFGELHVTSDSVHAKQQMWQSLVSLLKLFAVITVVLLASLYWVLTLLLKPLKALDNQAKAVENNEFLIVENSLSTLEFRNVVTAMNSIVKKIETIFHKETKTLEKYNELLYRDSDTKLGNRNYFELQMNTYFNAHSHLSFGRVMMIEFSDYEGMKKTIGFGKINTIIQALVQDVNAFCEAYEDMLFCRISSGTFLLVLPSSTQEMSDELSQKIYTSMEKTIQSLDIVLDQGKGFAIAMASYQQKSTIRELLTKLDFALAQAWQEDGHKMATFHEEIEKALTKEEWVETIEAIFKHQNLYVDLHPMYCDGKEYAKNFFTTIKDKYGTTYTPGEYLPILKSLGWLKKFNQYSIEQLLKTDETSNIIIPISTDLLDDRPFVKWLKTVMEKTKHRTLYFEFSNQSAMRKVSSLEEFTFLVKRSGHAIGLDDFSLQVIDSEYLKKINPAYIKIAQEYLLGRDAQAEIIGNVLSNIASSIGSVVVVKHVSKDEEISMLKDLGIDAYQKTKVDNG